MTLSEHARRTRLALRAGNREEALEAAADLVFQLSDRIEGIAIGACDGVERSEWALERITGLLCALAELMAAEAGE